MLVHQRVTLKYLAQTQAGTCFFEMAIALKEYTPKVYSSIEHHQTMMCAHSQRLISK